MEAQAQQKPQILSPWEISKANELLDKDNFPDGYRTNEIRVQVLVRAGWRTE